MRKAIIRISLYILAWILPGIALSQTADVTEGCSPLTVRFEGPDLPEYFWQFGDGGSSTLQNPEHIFSEAGVFTVTLSQGSGGEVIGTLTITVYPDPVIEITAEPVSGCSPLEVDFESLIAIDDAIDIQSYLWSFGDGTSSAQANPMHTYTLGGTYTVSLQIKTSIGECDKTVIFPDLIAVNNPSASFTISPSASCEIPVDVTITNTSPDHAGTTYDWDFGNGQTFDGYDPGTVTYNENGTYTISLTVTNADGCESMTTRVVTVGPPEIMVNIPDTICFGDTLFISNTTSSLFAQWNFGENANPATSMSKNPNVFYTTPGLKTITLHTFTFSNCPSDSSFEVYVQEPDASFIIDEGPFCLEPIVVHMEALNTGYVVYQWNDSVTTNPVFDYTYICPNRDSFHIDRRDEIIRTLYVTTTAGCMDTVRESFFIQKPAAYFYPLNARGCAPLSVTFVDSSFAANDIVSWNWLYGDGEEATFGNGNNHTHIYTEPGEYLIHLIVETEDGCIDTSAGTWIEVGEPISSQYNLSDDEICLGDSITIEIENLDPRIDAWHVSTDNGRFEHCWTSNSATHQFVAEPGVFDVEISIDYNGCINSETDSNRITINGAKADIGYMTSCEAPFDVMFNSESLNAGTVEWTFSEQDSSFEEMLTYTFDSVGNYIVYLEAVDAEGLCPVSIDSAEIFIREIKADFELPERVCDNFEYIMDASGSMGVDDDCSKGYLWDFANTRPREVNDDSIINYFTVLGPQEVTLIVEDINGCTDTLTKHTTSYGIDPLFTLDKDNICLPTEVSFMDQSTGDTTLVEWDWSFGGTQPNETFTFETTNPPGGNLIKVQLTVADAVGCRDSLVLPITVYYPISSITYDNGLQICSGDTINFFALDYTEQGSFLNFNWDFGILGESNVQDPTVVFPDPGFFPVELVYTEDTSGCTGFDEVTVEVVDSPIADFTTNVDGEPFICYPQIINFMNATIYDGPSNTFSLLWVFSDGFTTGITNPTYSFDKGTYEVQLIATSTFGCADSISRDFTLVGPEGDFVASDTSVCVGDFIDFMLIDTVSVSSFEWDFGDGSPIVENENPVSHQFQIPTTDPIYNTKVTLVLKSEETGCETVVTSPVTIYNFDSGFDIPNVFSPNGDGTNDNFNVVIKPGFEDSVQIIEFKVYNRWGNLIYDNDDPANGWDGTYNGEPVPSEVYAYFIEYLVPNCLSRSQKGNITIIR